MSLKFKTQTLHCQVFFVVVFAMNCLQIPFRNAISNPTKTLLEIENLVLRAPIL